MNETDEQTVSFTTYGIVNLMGDHAPDSDGLVLSMAVPKGTTVEVKPREDSKVSVFSTEEGRSKYPIAYELGVEAKKNKWFDYVQGVTQLLAKEGVPLKGVEIKISSTLPMKEGISSPAALQIGVLKALRKLLNFTMNDVILAKLSHKIENKFIGTPSGITEPLSSALIIPGQALWINLRTFDYKRVQVPLDKMAFVVIDLGTSRGENLRILNEKREKELREACELLKIKSVWELSVTDLPAIRPHLPENLLCRVRHILSENQSVVDAFEALTAGDPDHLGDLFNRSQVSMRDDFEMTTPEIDLMVKIVSDEPEAYGARLAGDARGDSLLILTQPNDYEAIGAKICKKYNDTGQAKATIAFCVGAKEIPKD